MEKSFKAHKEELLKAQQGQKLRLQNQFVETKDETTKVAKLALIGGASAFVGFKVLGLVFGLFGKKKRKKQLKNQEPQIVYVQQGGNGVVTKSDKKGTSVLWTLLLPVLINFAKQTGTQLAEKYGKELMEKYKDKLNLDKFIK